MEGTLCTLLALVVICTFFLNTHHHEHWSSQSITINYNIKGEGRQAKVLQY